MSRIFQRTSTLQGAAIALSASVPDTKRAESYQRVPDCQLHIEEGIISLARAVFAHSGRLVFGGHPTIVPLVSLVAAEYVAMQRLETKEVLRPPAVVYQSRAYEEVITDEERRMVEMRFAEEHLVEAVDGERYEPQRRGTLQCEQSLSKMRAAMIEEMAPAALVCMGGMEGVEREFQLFVKLQPDRPVWLWATTGGATAILAEHFRSLPNIHVVDAAIVDKLKRRVRGDDAPPESLDETPKIVPYPYLMQHLIEELGANGRKRPQIS